MKPLLFAPETVPFDTRYPLSLPFLSLPPSTGTRDPFSLPSFFTEPKPHFPSPLSIPGTIPLSQALLCEPSSITLSCAQQVPSLSLHPRFHLSLSLPCPFSLYLSIPTHHNAIFPHLTIHNQEARPLLSLTSSSLSMHRSKSQSGHFPLTCKNKCKSKS
ncbi:hypothetical protein AMTRI_Chr11g152720 [Amborella trichopoda]